MNAKSFFAAALVTVTTLAIAGPRAEAAPESSNRILSFGIGGGVSVPVNDAADAFKSGVAGQGFVCINLPGLPIRPRIDVTFQHFNLKDAAVVGPAVPTPSTDATGSVLAGIANIQVPLTHGRIRPYLMAGLGAYNVKSEDTSKTQFGINGGAGVSVKLSAFSLYLEGRVDNVYTDQGVIDTKSIQVVPVTFGIVF